MLRRGTLRRPEPKRHNNEQTDCFSAFGCTGVCKKKKKKKKWMFAELLCLETFFCFDNRTKKLMR